MMKKLMVLMVLVLALTSCSSPAPVATATVAPMVEPTVVPTVEPTVQPVEGITVSQLFDEFYGSRENYIEAWKNPVTFEFRDYYIEGTNYLNVLINGSPRTLVDDGSYVYVYFQEQTIFGRTVSLGSSWLFSEHCCGGSIDYAYYGIPMVDNDKGSTDIVFIPVGLMPKVVDDMSTWDRTEAPIYFWEAKGDDQSQIVQNLKTNEIYVGDFRIIAIDNDHHWYGILRGEWIWGHVTLDEYSIYITQSKPDYEKMEKAVEYFKLRFPMFASYDVKPFYACQYLQNGELFDNTDEDIKVAEEYCGVMFSNVYRN